jgi:hypothetical protein
MSLFFLIYYLFVFFSVVLLEMLKAWIQVRVNSGSILHCRKDANVRVNIDMATVLHMNSLNDTACDEFCAKSKWISICEFCFHCVIFDSLHYCQIIGSKYLTEWTNNWMKLVFLESLCGMKRRQLIHPDIVVRRPFLFLIFKKKSFLRRGRQGHNM